MKLTTIFTSSKIKAMFPLMVECGKTLERVLDELAFNAVEFEVKDLASRYGTDVIGSCAFGIETNSLENPNSTFRRMGKRLFEFRYLVWKSIW